jgi:hypothetical protein
MSEWQPIETLPAPGERPGLVFVIVEGHQHHSGTKWFRRWWGLARTHNKGFDEGDIAAIENYDHMDPGSGTVTHWMRVNLPPFPERSPT